MKGGMPRNPFRVQRLGPDGCAYVFPPFLDRTRLLDDVETAGWNAEICGPHGVGKSTLMQTVGAEARARCLRVAHWQARTDAPALPAFWRLRLLACDVVLMDGAEALRPGAARALLRATARLRVGLVTTTHRPQGHGHFVRLESSAECFAAMVAERLADESAVFRAALARQLGHAPEDALARANGDMRAAFFRLYDTCEDAHAALVARSVREARDCGRAIRGENEAPQSGYSTAHPSGAIAASG